MTELETLAHETALSIWYMPSEDNEKTILDALQTAYRLGQKAMQAAGGKANTPAQQARRAANLAAMNTPEALAARTAKRRANRAKKALEMKP